ncbi:MAG: hypothetical protein ACLGIE_00215 [Alphaproteobacteria bacterium]
MGGVLTVSPRQPEEGPEGSRWNNAAPRRLEDRGGACPSPEPEVAMNGIIYIVGLVVVVVAILSFFGLR